MGSTLSNMEHSEASSSSSTCNLLYWGNFPTDVLPTPAPTIIFVFKNFILPFGGSGVLGKLTLTRRPGGSMLAHLIEKQPSRAWIRHLCTQPTALGQFLGPIATGAAEVRKCTPPPPPPAGVGEGRQAWCEVWSDLGQWRTMLPVIISLFGHYVKT